MCGKWRKWGKSLRDVDGSEGRFDASGLLGAEEPCGSSLGLKEELLIKVE